MTMTIEEELTAAQEQIKELEHSLDIAEKECDDLETRLENKRQEPLDYQVLQLKHPALFTGDLNILTHGDRRELFEEIYNFSGQSDALTRIEHLIR